MRKPFLLTFLFLCQLHCDSATAQFNSFKFGRDISSGRKLLQDIYRVWNILLRQPDLGVKEALLQTEETEIIEKLKSISSKLSTLEQQVSSIADTTIETILQAFPKIVRLELRLYELSSIAAQINFAEEQMRKYLNHGSRNWPKDKLDTVRYMNEYEESLNENYTDGKRSTEDFGVSGIENSTGNVPAIEKQTMVDFALWATKHDYGSVLSMLNRLKELVAPKENFLGIFNLIDQVSKFKSIKMARVFGFNILSAIVFALGTKMEGNLAASSTSSSKSSTLSLVDNTRLQSVNNLNALWQEVNECNDVMCNSISNLDLLRTFQNITKNIAQVESFINPSDYYLFSSDWSYAQVDGAIANVNTFYETFLRFLKGQSKGSLQSQIAWTDLAETYLQNSDFGIVKSLEKIHRYASTEIESENLFAKIHKEIKSNLCNLRQSAHQSLYNLYNTVALAELKGNILLQFSYILLKMYDKGNFTVEARLAQTMYEENAEETIKVARNTLAEADRTIYRCDPKQYVEGVTYIKLTKLLQAYIENEVNLNPYGTCMENCAYYSYTQYNGCFKNKFCASQPQCRGKVMECRYVDSDMNICISSDPEKRYDWVEYENGKILGNKGVCEKKNFFKVDSWWRYLFWHCSYCLCLCDENVNSDRYFNRRDVTSDINNNKIVTGIRIVKYNRIIHLQIQQGILGMRGVVNQTSLSWKPVDNYTIDDENVENDVDYHTMTRFERAIDIDEVFAPPEYVVTGVRFRKVGTHLNLEVRVTPINFETGQLLKIDYSYWMGNDNTDASLKDPRTEIKLENPDIPIRHGPHLSISKHNQYVLFQASSFETDAGQSTVPFLDSQALTSKGFPISGVGLIHRGKLGSGGFIAPKLVSYDFTPHLNF